MSTYIYALTDPDGTPRYVGRSSSPRRRLVQHLSEFAVKAVREWVAELQARGEKPQFCLLYRVDQDGSDEDVERRYIRQLGTVGDLLNFRPGKCEGVLPAARQLRDWIHERGITQTRFARMLELDQSIVSRWLNGTSVPGVKSALKIQRATGIALELWDPDGTNAA